MKHRSTPDAESLRTGETDIVYALREPSRLGLKYPINLCMAMSPGKWPPYLELLDPPVFLPTTDACV